MQKLKKEQMENIQIDYGIVILNYGEEDAERLGPTKGGAEFNATKNIRDIEFDGAMGKTKGMQVIDEMDASLKFSILDTSLSTLAKTMPQADYDGVAKIIKNGAGGAIPASKYFKNITMFAKTMKGTYKKITLYNAMNESDFVLSSAPKAEGEIALEVFAHWDPEEVEENLYSIEDVTSISEPA
ncbi:hypothetical protein J1P26_22635 [Neobacillus sp. MM2021_6]|uniref:hypothetical protein n=1 Tax=Bacillaceae TaxID=186817 RepID=UPI001A941595|nr:MULTISPECIES: hypothetical protein [Bacillaceae]MBO0962495.1 hypothetical protein [Neobacillus sp. MM2021_6]